MTRLLPVCLVVLGVACAPASRRITSPVVPVDPEPVGATAQSRLAMLKGEAALARGALDEAGAFFAEASVLHPDSDGIVAARGRLARVWFERGALDEALETWSSLAPQDTLQRAWWAHALIEVGHIEEAAAVLGEPLEGLPEGDGPVELVKVELAAVGGVGQGAGERYLRASLHQNPDSLLHLDVLARVLEAEGKANEARALLEGARPRHPDSPLLERRLEALSSDGALP